MFVYWSSAVSVSILLAAGHYWTAVFVMSANFFVQWDYWKSKGEEEDD